jgi:hypothetical protein
VANPRLDSAFAIRIADATRHGDRPVVREHVAVERIERGIVEVRREHAFFEIVEHDGRRHATQSTEGALVQPTPWIVVPSFGSANVRIGMRPNRSPDNRDINTKKARTSVSIETSDTRGRSVGPLP